MAKKKIEADPLVGLLEAADRELLITLIAELAAHRLDVRRACFDYLSRVITSGDRHFRKSLERS